MVHLKVATRSRAALGEENVSSRAADTRPATLYDVDQINVTAT